MVGDPGRAMISRHRKVAAHNRIKCDTLTGDANDAILANAEWR